MHNLTPTKRPGQTFVHFLLIATVAWIVLYILLHLAIDPEGRFAKNNVNDAFYLTAQGEFLLFDATTLTWNVGKSKATPILNRLDERNATLRHLMENIRIDAHRLKESLDRESKNFRLDAEQHPTQLIEVALSQSSLKSCEPKKNLCYQATWDEPLRQVSKLHIELHNLNGYAESNAALSRLKGHLSQLKQQSFAQYIDASALRISRAQSFFWSSPEGSSAEIIFFAVFGVLANLLVKSAEYLRNNNFKQNERWVAYTKLVYGPIIAWILVTAIAVGWFDLGEYQIGTYSLPLLAFVLGFYSRKTVNLFSRLGDHLLGKAQASVEKGPAEILASRQAYQAQFLNLLAPRSYQEIKQTAFDIKDEIVKTEVMKLEARK
ncbi:hypothetical protein [Alteromonas gracilis]|uniref:hypothetical protein n=1 Tax=Alteromonas gracilis TaxID=1479524 RepID=UPI003735BB64